MERDLTKETIRAFVAEGIAALGKEEGAASPLLKDEEEHWVRRDDGHYERTRVERVEYYSLYRRIESLRSLPTYGKAHAQIMADPVLAPQMERMFGARGTGLRHIDADDILRHLIHAIIDSRRSLAFDNETFEAEWARIEGPLYQSSLFQVSVAPLLGLTISRLPISLAENLGIDRLSDEEVRRCIRGGLYTPRFAQNPLIDVEGGLGVRWTTAHTKRQPNEDPQPYVASDEVGSFGQRPSIHGKLLVDDVLTVLRLVKSCRAWCPGVVSWTRDWDNLGTFIGMRALRIPPYAVPCSLDDSESDRFETLWRKLSSGLLKQKRVRFIEAALRRFLFSFDRFQPEDRLVDLLIAGESLFLHDSGDAGERGELGFRLAIRAGKFVNHGKYTPLQVFKIMQRAYKIRSVIVHGSTPSKRDLPDAPNVTFAQFTDAIEEIIRLGIRKALDEAEGDIAGFGKPEYWEGLLFSD